jgi:two-component system cell cycle response regulator CtrA
MKVLLIAPKTAFVTELGIYLTLEGNQVTVVPSRDAAVALASTSAFDAVLLSFEAITSDMAETIRFVQTAWSNTPLLVLEAGQGSRSSVLRSIDTLSGSSVTNANVLSRLRAIWRRAQGYREQTLQTGQLQLNRGTHEVWVDGTKVDLTQREAQLLEILMISKGAVLTNQAVLSQLYGGVNEPDAKIVDIMICKLRRKLARTGAEVAIKTVHNCGYTISGPLRTNTDQIVLCRSGFCECSDQAPNATNEHSGPEPG